MPLIQKKVSSALVAANRANSRKSTGPRTELGKMHSSGNAAKQLIHAKVFAPTMKELGEDPAEFDKLHDQLRQAFKPQDGFEEMLVEDMVVTRWRLGRVRRAEMGILAVQQMKLENRLRPGPVNRGASYDNLMIHYYGLSGVSESAEKYLQILRVLISLVENVEKEGFCPEGLKMLETVYGPSPGVTGLALIFEYKTHLESRGDDSQPQSHEERKAAREGFLKNLQDEIEAFLAHAKAMKLAQDIPLPESIKHAELIPAEQDMERILRYETALERQFERKLQQLVAWRRERKERKEGAEKTEM